MTRVPTPSQLKKEVVSQKELLRRACLEAFNQLPSQRLQGAFQSTYALAAKLSQLLQQTK